MDALSDILALLEPQNYLTAGLITGGAWALRFANRPGTIKCYAVVRGECWLSMDDAEPALRLAAGDCVILPSGRPFTLGSDLTLPPASGRDVLGSARPGEMVSHNGDDDFLLVGTRFEVNERKPETLLGALPSVIHLQAVEQQAALRWCIEQMMAEMREGRPGGSLAAHHLAHLMLLQAFRLHLTKEAGTRVGVLYALSDAHLGKAIEVMHTDPAHRWTIGQLANKSGLSRSIFAHRFREKVGESPITYLTRWRMTLAAERLVSGRESISEVAQTVGYGSENAFSTAFKRVMGDSPRRYARAGRAIGSKAFV